MNWKIILIGGVAYYVTIFVLSFISGQVVHEGILDPAYRATTEFWRPELNQDPPDMAALMPMWIFNGLVGAFVVAAIYTWIRPAFHGPAWRRGLTYGLILSLLGSTFSLGYSGVFNLPGEIWFWWTIEMAVLFIVGATVLGLVAEKLAPE
ncbi:MAG: hypothetical protein OER80_06650 [Gammaproteobacteria bacterium]|nr:hypothetical protein [Gammaproteobacteria bacterium]MDH3766947.1 hypothetical protein [Gammaproteobacteria bacterium]